MPGDQSTDWKYWIGLQQVRRIGPRQVEALQRAFDDDLERAWRAPLSELTAVLGEKVAAKLDETRQTFDLEAAAAGCLRLGHSVITWQDARYPDLLRETSAPPLVLYVLGELTPDDATAVSVIGSRDSTAYGREVARELGADLASAGVTVVSGLARGIDGVAHRAALDAGGRTIAVLGGSLDWIYPAEHNGLARQIANQGALISEYPTRSRPVPGNFRARNRIMAGLSIAVVIVEARIKSGTLITANYAAHYNREVFAVPGSVHSEASEGCLQLIREGATLVRNAADILTDLNLGVAPAVREPELEAAVSEIDTAVLGALRNDSMHIDDLAAELDLPITEVATALMMLELTGRVRNLGSQHFGRVR
ncbi:MAG: DNA-protecting protein DprA [Thermomicrobiales bacterium]|nr:DNA-protecting protein DprA [Thermomicrobiales bacterium]